MEAEGQLKNSESTKKPARKSKGKKDTVAAEDKDK